MGQYQDLTGKIFNGIEVLRPTDKRDRGSVVWVCRCTCGKEFETRASSVKDGHTKSCGCLMHREHRTRTEPQICRHCGEISTRKLPSGFYSRVCSKCANNQGEFSRDDVARMVGSARVRAKKKGLPFNLEAQDLTIPEFCPVLGIKMERGPIAERDSSPSLDRLVPELGYALDNVSVISHRANRIKNNGTADEHRRIADWIDAQTKETANAGTF